MIIARCEQPSRNERTVAPHHHAETEWHFAVAGACGFDIGTSASDLVAGDLMVVPQGIPHRLRIRRPGEWLLQIIIATRPEGDEDAALLAAIQHRAGDHGVLHLGSQRHVFFAALAHDLASGDRFRQRGAGLRFTALLCELASGVEATGHPVVARALALMRERLGGRLTLVELAAEAGCGRSVLARRFKSEIGVSPLAYFMGLRLDLAADLLRQGGRQVQEVARASGFDDPYHFSRCFKQRFGKPPSAWV